MGMIDFDDTYKAPYSPPRFNKEKDNFESLQKLGHKEVSEDYSDEITRRDST